MAFYQRNSPMEPDSALCELSNNNNAFWFLILIRHITVLCHEQQK